MLVGRRPLHRPQQVGHAGHLLALLAQEPGQELLADQVALLAREPGERLDLARDLLLLGQREPHRLDGVREVQRGAGTPGMVTCAPASMRYWTMIIAWLRSSTAWR